MHSPTLLCAFLCHKKRPPDISSHTFCSYPTCVYGKKMMGTLWDVPTHTPPYHLIWRKVGDPRHIFVSVVVAVLAAVWSINGVSWAFDGYSHTQVWIEWKNIKMIFVHIEPKCHSVHSCRHAIVILKFISIHWHLDIFMLGMAIVKTRIQLIRASFNHKCITRTQTHTHTRPHYK